MAPFSVRYCPMFISQADIDHILRTGGNEDDARMKIVAEFSKQKPLENRATFLKALYHGGNGLITENGKISAWYSEDGIYIAVSAIAAECPAQFPLCCQPHKRHLPVKLFVFGRTDACRFLEEPRKIFQITVADLISDVLHRVFITA